MSLFRSKEWWAKKSGDQEEFDRGCLCVENVDNAADGSVKIVVGSFQGFLRIFYPRQKEFHPEDLLFEQNLGAPIIFLEAGRILPGSRALGLAVLHPRKLVVYAVSRTEARAEGADAQGTYFSLEKRYEHALEHSAHSLCLGGACGPSGEQQVLLVQSLDGQWSIFDAGRLAFARFLPDVLLPGPVCYLPLLDAFVTASAALQLECYTMRALAASTAEHRQPPASVAPGAAPGQQADQLQRTQQPAIAMEWVCNVGEPIRELCVGRFSRSTLAASQQEVIALGERTVFTINSRGQIRLQTRLDVPPAALTLYPVPESAELEWHNVLLASSTGTLRVYREARLLWAASTPAAATSDPVVALRVAGFGGHQGMICTLDDTGRLAVCYLGTDPANHFVPSADAPVEQQGKTDFEALDRELARLQALLKAAQPGSGRLDPPDHVSLRLLRWQPQQPHGAAGQDAATPGVSASAEAQLEVAYKGPADDPAATQLLPPEVTVAVTVQTPFVCRDAAVVVPLADTLRAVELPLRVERCDGPLVDRLPTALAIHIAASYVNAKGEPRTAQWSGELPLWLACRVVAPQKAPAPFKLTLDTGPGREPLPLVDLFAAEVSASGAESLQAPGVNVLTFQYIPGRPGQPLGPEVSILASKNAGRYRVQANTFEALGLIVGQLAGRLSAFFSAPNAPGAGTPLVLSCEEEPPMHDYLLLVNDFLKLRTAAAEDAAAVGRRAEQLRAVQKRLLVRYRDKNAVPLGALDVLLDGAYLQLQSAAANAQATQQALTSAAHRLAAGGETLLQFVRLRCQLDSSPPTYTALRAALAPENVVDSVANGAAAEPFGWLEAASCSLDYLSLLLDAGPNQPPLPSSSALSLAAQQGRGPTRQDDTSNFVRALTAVTSKLSSGARLLLADEKQQQQLSAGGGSGGAGGGGSVPAAQRRQAGARRSKPPPQQQ